MNHMQLNMIAFLIFLTALMLLPGCGGPEGESVFTPSRPDVPAIVFDSTEHDFGAVAAGSENTCTFAFINDGGKDLVIESVYASCGCTATNLADTTIKPGQASEICVTYLAGSTAGIQKKRVLLYTNDPENKEITIWVKATVSQSEFTDSVNSPKPEISARSLSPGSVSFRKNINFLKQSINP